MSDNKLPNLPTKKAWIQPTISVIDLSAARNKNPHNTLADGTYSKS
jgi:hypothetical protein